METGLNTLSIVYNGDTMNKVEVMQYLANVVRISKEFHETMSRLEGYRKQIDAINLYHQELHWKKMEDIAKEQSRQAQAAYYRQESMLMEQAQMQREQLQEMQNTADQALAAAKSAEFYSEMNYLFNTYYNS